MSNLGLTNNATRKILVVDDHARFRALVRDLLVRRGDTVIECTDGAGALAMFEAERPDAVIMDIEMPGLDGISATREIRKSQPGACIVVISQYEGELMAIEARAAGALDFISKDRIAELPNILNKLGGQNAAPKQTI